MNRPSSGAAAVLLAGLVVLAGCADADRALNGVDEAAEQRNVALLEEVASRLRRADGVTQVTVGYTDSMTNEGLAVVDVSCRRCDEQAVAAEAERLVWLSDVAPLVSMNVSVSDLATVEDAVAGGAVQVERERLVEQYGERPVPDGD